MNDRACMLVLNNVARYPQHWDSGYITADTLLQEINPEAEPHRLTGIGIVEIAQINPDGKKLADTVHAIHDRFGITDPNGEPLRVSHDEVRNTVRTGGHVALRAVLKNTLAGAEYFGVAAPNALTRQPRRQHAAFMHGSNVAPQMLEYLQEEPLVRSYVFQSLGVLAAQTKAKSRARQQEASSANFIPARRQRNSH